MSKTKEVIKYFAVNAESKEGNEEICLQCVAAPTKERLLLFLNNIYSVNRYLTVSCFHEVSKDEAESKGLDKEIIYATNYFELACTASDETEMKFCITGIDEPTREDALEFINSSLKDADKMKSVNWIKPVDMAEAVKHYDMEHWTRPWDLEL